MKNLTRLFLSVQSAVVGVIIAEAGSYTDAAAYNLFDATVYSYSEVSQINLCVQNAVSSPYLKYGLVILLSDNTKNYNIDISAPNIPDIEWLWICGKSSNTPVQFTARENQIVNLSLTYVDLTLTQKINLKTLEFATGCSVLKNTNNLQCKNFHLQLLCMPFYDIINLGLGAQKVFFDPSYFGFPTVQFDYSYIHFETLVLNFLWLSYSRTTINIDLEIGTVKLPKIEFLFDFYITLSHEISFKNWEKQSFEERPNISFFCNYQLDFVDNPSNIDIAQYNLGRNFISYQNPILTENYYICHNLPPLGVEPTITNLLTYVDNAQDVRNCILKVVPKLCKNIVIFSTDILGSPDPISFIGIPSGIQSIRLEGQLFKNDQGVIGFSNFFINVDDTVRIENMFVNRSVVNINGLSKMRVGNMVIESIEGSKIIGRVNVDNAYVDYKLFKSSFDSITIENLYLRINLTSDAELMYDTRGWELTEGSSSSIIVLSSSSAVATKVYFYIYTNGCYTVTLNLRKTDIKQIKGLDFTVIKGLKMSGELLEANPSDDDSVNNYTVAFMFEKESWKGSRLVNNELVFRTKNGAGVKVDASNAPENFEIIFPDQSNGTIPETPSTVFGGNEDDERKARNKKNSIIVSIVVPVFVVLVGIIIIVVYLFKKAKKNEGINEDENQPILDDNEANNK